MVLVPPVVRRGSKTPETSLSTRATNSPSNLGLDNPAVSDLDVEVISLHSKQNYPLARSNFGHTYSHHPRGAISDKQASKCKPPLTTSWNQAQEILLTILPTDKYSA